MTSQSGVPSRPQPELVRFLDTVLRGDPAVAGSPAARITPAGREQNLSAARWLAGRACRGI